MANLIDLTYFIGDIQLPTDQVQAKLLQKIKTAEPEILTKILGYDLYKKMLASPNSEPYKSLIEGKEYESDGYYYKWRGFTNAEKESLIAFYVWLKFVQKDGSYVSGSGIMKNVAENSILDITDKLIASNYNQMIDMINEMNDFINANIDDFPTFQESNMSKFLYF